MFIKGRKNFLFPFNLNVLIATNTVYVQKDL